MLTLRCTCHPLCLLPLPCWQFECDEIPEEELMRIFFADGRSFDGTALKQHMVRPGTVWQFGLAVWMGMRSHTAGRRPACAL